MATKKTKSSPPVSSKSSEKVKTAEDGKLIKRVFKYEALDWARYTDGRLVFISPDGKKNILTKDEIDALVKPEITTPAPVKE